MQRKTCGGCSALNPGTAVFCRQCGRRFSRMMLPGSGSVIPSQSGTIMGRGDINSNLGSELNSLYWALYSAAEETNRGNPLWEMGGKHLEAFRNHQNVEQLRRRLEELMLQKYEELFTQAMNAYIAREALLQEDERTRLRTGLQINQFADAVKATELMDLGTTLPDDVRAELVRELVFRIIDQIFPSSPLITPVSPRSSINGGLYG